MYSNVVLLPYGQEPALIANYATHSEHKTSNNYQNSQSQMCYNELSVWHFEVIHSPHFA
jgi:hypothetical protein